MPRSVHGSALLGGVCCCAGKGAQQPDVGHVNRHHLLCRNRACRACALRLGRRRTEPLCGIHQRVHGLVHVCTIIATINLGPPRPLCLWLLLFFVLVFFFVIVAGGCGK